MLRESDRSKRLECCDTSYRNAGRHAYRIRAYTHRGYIPADLQFAIDPLTTSQTITEDNSRKIIGNQIGSILIFAA